MLGQSTPFWSILLEERKVTRMVHVHQVTMNSAAHQQAATLPPARQCSAALAGLAPTLRGTGCTSPLLRTPNSYLCNKHTTNEQYHCDRTGSIQLSFYRHISQSSEYPKQAVNKMMNHQHSERVSLQFRLVQPCFTSLLVSSKGHDAQTK